MILELKDICKTYYQGKMEVPVLKDVSLSVAEGEYLAIMGPSGSGKTTLMNLIGCLDVPTSGTYLLEGEDLSDQSDAQLSKVRLHSIGFVFQSFHLLSRQTAVENVALPLLYAGVRRKERIEKAKIALERVGLGDRISFKPTQLSGGQCQRVAIARAIVNDPKILLADEPTGALDSSSGEQIMEVFKRLNDEGVTVVMITHDQDIAAHAKRIVHIRDGRVTEEQTRPALVRPRPVQAAAAPVSQVPASQEEAPQEPAFQKPDEVSSATHEVTPIEIEDLVSLIESESSRAETGSAGSFSADKPSEKISAKLIDIAPETLITVESSAPEEQLAPKKKRTSKKKTAEEAAVSEKAEDKPIDITPETPITVESSAPEEQPAPKKKRASKKKAAEEAAVSEKAEDKPVDITPETLITVENSAPKKKRTSKKKAAEEAIAPKEAAALSGAETEAEEAAVTPEEQPVPKKKRSSKKEAAAVKAEEPQDTPDPDLALAAEISALLDKDKKQWNPYASGDAFLQEMGIDPEIPEDQRPPELVTKDTEEEAPGQLSFDIWKEPGPDHTAEETAPASEEHALEGHTPEASASEEHASEEAMPEEPVPEAASFDEPAFETEAVQAAEQPVPEKEPQRESRPGLVEVDLFDTAFDAFDTYEPQPEVSSPEVSSPEEPSSEEPRGQFGTPMRTEIDLAAAFTKQEEPLPWGAPAGEPQQPRLIEIEDLGISSHEKEDNV